MDQHPELTKAQSDMRSQNALYQPTAFWEKATQLITQELQMEGMDQFRRLPTPTAYFVPSYGPPTLGMSPVQVARVSHVLAEEFPEHKKSHLVLQAYLSGHLNALADYRVLLAADDASHLPHLQLTATRSSSLNLTGGA
jgi:putative sugar O-methyltransferase